MAYVEFESTTAQLPPPAVAAGLFRAGTEFTIINNTAATEINGAFDNLPDGSTLIIGSNTYEVSYEGGDGNDLTLTVVP
jgi:hypothetical protein